MVNSVTELFPIEIFTELNLLLFLNILNALFI